MVINLHKPERITKKIALIVSAPVVAIVIGVTFVNLADAAPKMTFDGQTIRNAEEFRSATEQTLFAAAAESGAVQSADAGCSFVEPPTDIYANYPSTSFAETDIAPSLECGPFLLSGQQGPKPHWVAVSFTGTVQADEPDKGVFLDSTFADEDFANYAGVFSAGSNDGYSNGGSVSSVQTKGTVFGSDANEPQKTKFLLPTGKHIVMDWKPRMELNKPKDETFRSLSLAFNSNGSATSKSLSDGQFTIEAAEGELIYTSIDEVTQGIGEDEALVFNADDESSIVRQLAASEENVAFIGAAKNAKDASLEMTVEDRTFTYELFDGAIGGDYPDALRIPELSDDVVTPSETFELTTDNWGSTNTINWSGTFNLTSSAFDEEKGWAPKGNYWLTMEAEPGQDRPFNTLIDVTSVTLVGGSEVELSLTEPTAVPLGAQQGTLEFAVHVQEYEFSCWSSWRAEYTCGTDFPDNKKLMAKDAVVRASFELSENTAS